MKLIDLIPVVEKEIKLIKQDIKITECCFELSNKTKKGKGPYHISFDMDYDFIDVPRASKTFEELTGVDEDGLKNFMKKKRKELELIQSSYNCIVNGTHFDLHSFDERKLIIDGKHTAVEILNTIRSLKIRMPYNEMSIGFCRHLKHDRQDINIDIDNIFTIDTEKIGDNEFSVVVPWSKLAQGMYKDQWMQYPYMYFIYTLYKPIDEALKSCDLHSSQKFPLSLSVSINNPDRKWDNGGVCDGSNWGMMESYCVYTGKIKAYAKLFGVAESDEIMTSHMELRAVLESVIMPFLFLINTKGISTDNIVIPESINKKRIKFGKPPLQSYKVLKFEMPKEYSKNMTPSEIEHMKKRLHTCMGHTRIYTEDAPLFGHYIGPVWIPPHIRGNKELGVITKDYEKKEQA